MKQKFVLGLSILLALIVAGAGWFIAPYLLRVERFPADPAQGYYADFYLYVSPKAQRAARAGQPVTILVQPNNSGTNSDDPEVHQRDAWWTGFERYSIANDLGVILLVPAFVRPGTDWHIYSHALDRDTLTTARPDVGRLDLQLIAMVDTARARLEKDGIMAEEKFLIQGFSASGMFANRFTAMHPERVKAVTAGSPGGWPILPLAEQSGTRLNYPIGIADLEQLTGKPFDAEAFNQVPQLIYMGSADDNDSLDFIDGWEPEMAAIVDELFGETPLERWDDVEAAYKSAGASVEFLLIDGIGHDRRALQHHSTIFFEKILDR
ncbi:MAG: hypothetical protein AAGD96_03360 [Chloroflexota bacterium]